MDAEEKKLTVKLAYGYYQNKDYNKAAQLYARLHESDKDDYNVSNMLGDALVRCRGVDRRGRGGACRVAGRPSTG